MNIIEHIQANLEILMGAIAYVMMFAGGVGAAAIALMIYLRF